MNLQSITSNLTRSFNDNVTSPLTEVLTDAVDFDGKGRDLAPFVSILIVIATLLGVVFCKMEMRRMGYSVLQLTRLERKMRDQERQQMIQLAKITRPERVQAVAQGRLTLKKAESGQIIQMPSQWTGRGVAKQ